MGTTHELKTMTPYWQDVYDGKKTFEVRFNDRGFKVGDVLVLREIDKGIHTKRALKARVKYVLEGPDAIRVGIAPGFCVASIDSIKLLR